MLLRLYVSWFITSLAINASDYYISYRYLVKDAYLYNESLQVSRTMTNCQGILGDAIILDNNENSDLKKILTDNSQLFINYIHQLGLNVKHNEITLNGINHSTTILTLKTTCFKVDFNDTFVKIQALK